MRSLAAANTLATMCAGVTWRSGRDREVQYAVYSCVMTSSLRRCHRLASRAAGCYGPCLFSARRRSAWSGGGSCWLMTI